MKHKFTAPEIILILVFSYALLSSLFHAITRHSDGGFRRQITCTSNQKQIATEVHMFAQENDSLLPTKEYILNTLFAGSLKCPSAKKTPGYGYNSRLLGKRMSGFKEPKIIILTADTINDNLLIKRAADFDFRHKNERCVVAYLDGHIVAFEGITPKFHETMAINFVEKVDHLR